MKISIIVPVYNVSNYIERCLESVISQGMSDIECILVDDCGQDDSVEKVLGFINRYKGTDILFKILHHERNRGLSAARNTGVEHASGDYVLFLDSDDQLASGALSNLYRLVIKYGDVDIVQGIYSRNGIDIAKHYFKDEYYEGNAAQDAYLYNEICLTAWNKLVKLSLAKQTLFIEGIINEDNPWNFLLFKKLRRLCVCKEITYIYNITPNSIMSSTSYKERSIKSFMVVYDAIIGEMESMTMDRPYPIRKILDRYVFGFMLMPGSTKDTYEATRRRLLILYNSNRKYMSTRDWFISRPLAFSFPCNTIFAMQIKKFLNLLCRLHLANYSY